MGRVVHWGWRTHPCSSYVGLDGRAIMQAAGASKGKGVSQVMAKAFEWQLARAEATAKEARAWVVDTYTVDRI